MNVKDIQFVEEKKAILLYYMKRTYGKKSPILNYTRMLQMYKHWWNEDMKLDGEGRKYRKIFPGKKQIRQPVNGIVIDEEYQKYFDDMFVELEEKYKTMSLEEIKIERMKTHIKRYIPKNLQKEAEKIGYKILQGNIRKHPYKLSGYCIIHIKGRNKVAGIEWDMTLEDVKAWIETKKVKQRSNN